MGLNNIVLLSQVTGYVIALIFSLCIVIPMSLHQDEFRFVYNIRSDKMHSKWYNFRGHCLLFSSGCWQETDGQLQVHWASQGYCNYTIFVGVILLLVSATQIYR